MYIRESTKYKHISVLFWKSLNVIIRGFHWIIPVKIKKFLGLSFIQAGNSFVVYSGTYHPVEYLNISTGSKARLTYDRWNIIKKVISDHAIKNVFDIGCAEGYFVRKAADEFNCVAAGVDVTRERISTAFNSGLFRKHSSAAYFYCSISKIFLSNLPKFDMILCLSIMHHIMVHNGQEYALDLLKLIKSKTGTVLIYEMGQSNEIESDWSTQLPDMGENPYEWIKSFLSKAGYNTVEMIGETDTYCGKSTVKRGVFAAYP